MFIPKSQINFSGFEIKPKTIYGCSEIFYGLKWVDAMEKEKELNKNHYKGSDLNSNGYDGWALPTAGYIRLMCEQFPNMFSDKINFWTRSSISDERAFYLVGSNGCVLNGYKNDKMAAIFIR